MARNILGNIYLFNQFSEAELERLESIAEAEKFSSGDRIFEQGDTADRLYVIKYGSVQIRQSDQGEDSKMVVSTMGSGSHFGEMSMIDDEKRSAGATAMEQSEIIVIRYPALLKLLDQQPAIAVKFYRSIARYLSGRLRRTTTSLEFVRDRGLHS